MKICTLQAAALIWFEIWEGRGSGSTKFQFFQAHFREILIFSGNFTKNFDFHSNFKKLSIFPGKFSRNFDFSGKFSKNFNFSDNFWKNFDFFRQFKKKFDFPGKNCSFTATSAQIILFLFKSHHLRTYFLSIPVQDPSHDPSHKIWGSRPPNPPDWCPCLQGPSYWKFLMEVVNGKFKDTVSHFHSPGDGLVMTLMAAEALRSQSRAVLSCDPLMNIQPPHEWRA